MSEELQGTIQEWVCVESGFKLKDKATRGVEFMVLPELKESRIYPIKLFRSARVGQVYKIQAYDGGCYPTTLAWVGAHKDREQAAAWEANHVAAELERKRKRLLGSAKTNEALVEALAPVRKLYLKTPNRAAFAYAVLMFLRSGVFDW